MSKHDPFCYQFVEHCNLPSYCFCDLIASVRADERERMAYLARVVPGGGIRDWAAAEAVAAKLVEVICEQDREWAGTEWRAMRRERDAARAEVAALTDALDIAKDERYAARVEQARAAQRLRDLRAKVEGLHHDGLCSVTAQMGSCDCLRGEVLALLDEVQP